MNTVSALEAIKRLKEGNRRFVNNLVDLNSLSHNGKRESSISIQTPFAIVLSCSDSRVPSEIVFGQGLGDLFVIRVAGNVVAPSIIGSVEFAASTFGTQLVVVMGHSHCGAVAAAVDSLKSGQEVPSENIRDIVNRINPAIRPLVEANQREDLYNRAELLDRCIKTNITASVSQLLHGSKIIENLIEKNKLMIVAAEYSLETGQVEFFENSKDKKRIENKTDRANIDYGY